MQWMNGVFRVPELKLLLSLKTGWNAIHYLGCSTISRVSETRCSDRVPVQDQQKKDRQHQFLPVRYLVKNQEAPNVVDVNYLSRP